MTDRLLVQFLVGTEENKAVKTMYNTEPSEQLFGPNSGTERQLILTERQTHVESYLG